MSSTPDEPDEPATPEPERPAPAGAPADVPASPPDTAPPSPPPYIPPAPESAAPTGPSPYGPPANSPPPYGPPAYAPPPTVEPSAQPAFEGPGVWAGVGTGCGLQFLAALVFIFTMFAAGSMWGPLSPAILITVAGIVLMFVKRWRRFGTGILIVSAATWLIVLGPCIALVGGFR